LFWWKGEGFQLFRQKTAGVGFLRDASSSALTGVKAAFQGLDSRDWKKAEEALKWLHDAGLEFDKMIKVNQAFWKSKDLNQRNDNN
jgi:hypothetical protein